MKIAPHLLCVRCRHGVVKLVSIKKTTQDIYIDNEIDTEIHESSHENVLECTECGMLPNKYYILENGKLEYVFTGQLKENLLELLNMDHLALITKEDFIKRLESFEFEVKLKNELPIFVITSPFTIGVQVIANQDNFRIVDVLKAIIHMTPFDVPNLVATIARATEGYSNIDADKIEDIDDMYGSIIKSSLLRYIN